MGNENNIYKWIDLSVLPKKYNEGKRVRIDWEGSIGIPVPFKYGDISSHIIITKTEKNTNNLWVHVDGYTFYDDYKICKNSFKNACFGSLLIEKIITSAPELVQYFDNISDAQIYAKYSHHRSNMHCPLCGYKKKMYIDTLSSYGFSCPNCSDSFSYPSKFIRNFLIQLNIDFIQEVTKKNEGFEWLGNYRYDFYFEVNNKRIFLEADGHFHYGDYFEKYETSHNRDLIKDKLAHNNNIDVIRINCKYPNGHRFEYIRDNIINSELNLILNLDNFKIDWNMCDKYAQSSIIVEICDLWNSGKYKICEIAELLKVGSSTIRRYLKDANRIGLCRYDANETKTNGLRFGWEQVKKRKSKP